MNDLVIMERQNIVDIADAIRNKAQLNDELTLADMVAGISGIKSSGGEPLFVSSAVGILPEVVKGTANSAFTLNFESTAVGALQEE